MAQQSGLNVNLKGSPMYDEFSNNDAWDFHLQQDEVREMDDAKALEIFRETPFLHIGAKDHAGPPN